MSDERLKGEVTVRCAHGDTTTYPLAEVATEVQDIHFKGNVGVSTTLPVSVLLGTDFPKLMELLGRSQGDALVVTRAQAKSMEMQRSKQVEKEEMSGAHPSPAVDDCAHSEETDRAPSSKEANQDPIPGMDFAEELFVAGKERVRQSRRQKQLERRRHAVQAQEHPLDLTIEELQGLQQADETLAEVREAGKGGTSRAGIGFYYQDGVIYRSWVPRG